jgi:hypothetical protein
MSTNDPPNDDPEYIELCTDPAYHNDPSEKSPNPSKPIPRVPAAKIINGRLYYYETPVDQMDAWPIALAARLIGLGYHTLREDIKRGLLKLSHHGLVTRAELARYLRDGIREK